MPKYTWNATHRKLATYDMTPGLSNRVSTLLTHLEASDVGPPTAVELLPDGVRLAVRLIWSGPTGTVLVQINTKKPTMLTINAQVAHLARVKTIVKALAEA